jgi:hypothetical protein
MGHSLITLRGKTVQINDLVLLDLGNAMKRAVAEQRALIHDAQPEIIALMEEWDYKMKFPPGIKNIDLDQYIDDSRSMNAFTALFKRATELMYKDGIVGERWQANIDLLDALIASEGE